MSKIETIIREVDASMAMEGLPLTSQDKTRIRDCLTGKTDFDEVTEQLIKKHTVLAQ